MITTVTLNPSIDIAYTVEELNLDKVNRVETVNKTAGGKGVNVARVLNLLGEEVIATGLIGGQHGKYLKNQLDQLGIMHQFVPIKGETRDSIAILHGSRQTELLERGPFITKKEQQTFTDHFEQLLEMSDIMTISGSLPQGCPLDYYKQLVALADKKGKDILLDTSGKFLLEVLKGKEKPLLIKPNLEELGELIGQRICSSIQLEKIQSLLAHPIFEGVPWVVVSLGERGAVAKVAQCFYEVIIPKISVVNPVGSDDATLAGSAHALSKRQSIEEILAFSMACGMANAQQEKTGWIDPMKVTMLMKHIQVKKIK